MGAAVPVIGAGLTVASAFMSAKNQKAQGAAQQRALQYKAQQDRIQEEYANINEKRTEAGQRDALTTSLEQISALQAGRGVGSDSPTARVISDNLVDRGEADIAANKLGFEAKKQALRSDAALSESEGALAVKAADRAATATMLGAAGNVFNLFSYGRTGRSAL